MWYNGCHNRRAFMAFGNKLFTMQNYVNLVVGNTRRRDRKKQTLDFFVLFFNLIRHS